MSTAPEKKTRELPCKLTDAELQVKGSRMAEAMRESDEALELLEAVKQTTKHRTAALDAEVKGLAIEIRTRTEYRDVEIVTELLPNAQAREVRTDTGEVILERPMTQEEVNQELPFAVEPEPGQAPRPS